MIFISDPPKRLTNFRTHGFDLDDAADCQWDDALILPGYCGKRGEPRFKAIVPYGDDLVVVVSPSGSEAVSVISMRRANRNERRDHAER